TTQTSTLSLHDALPISLAADVDRDFVVALRSYLFQYETTRNGKADGRPKALSGRQVINVLECLRTMFAWAREHRAEAFEHVDDRSEEHTSELQSRFDLV